MKKILLLLILISFNTANAKSYDTYMPNCCKSSDEVVYKGKKDIFSTQTVRIKKIVKKTKDKKEEILAKPKPNIIAKEYNFNNINNLTRETGSFFHASGEDIIIAGRIVDKDCVPFTDLTIEIWQDGYNKRKNN
jgi:protocatechuate 3,4-dioxygenase beta subunit